MTTAPWIYQNDSNGDVLSTNEEMYIKFMRKTFSRLIKIAPDEKFKQILNFMENTFNTDNAVSYMYMVLTVLSMP